jgi:hypothetical protein
MARNVLKYLKDTTLNTFYKVCRHHNITDKFFNYNSQTGIIKWHNGSEIILRELRYNPSDPLFEDLGSLELTGAFVDEATEISFKAFDVLKSRIGRQNNTKYNLYPKILCTGNPNRNWVYNTFIKKPQDGYKFVQSLPDDNAEFLDECYIESLNSISDTVTKQRLRFGNWEYDDDPGVLLRYQKIAEIYSNSFVPQGEKFITCDVARKGKDKSVVMLWDGWCVSTIIELAHNTIIELADTINALRSANSIGILNVIADEDGVGGGLVDILGCNGFVNNSRPAEQPTENVTTENFENLRSQCIFKLCQNINANKLYIKDAPQDTQTKINEELSVVKRTDITNDKKVSIISRDVFIKQIGRSPEYLSALMMRVWFDIAKLNYKTAIFNFL